MRLRGYKNELVWIVGASTGIGHALARVLAAQGARLALSARSRDELESLRESLGAHHRVFVVDVTDADTLARTAQAIHAACGCIDRVIFLAAAYAPMTLDALDLAVTRRIIDVNLTGAFNLVAAVLPLLKQQPERAQIALCGSVAGYTGLPSGQPYSATKAGIVNLAESLHAETGEWLDVKLISPGFVKTPLTEHNTFNMPMIISAETAAEEIAHGLQGGRFEIHFPRRFTVLVKLLRLLPYSISLKILRRIKE